MSYVVQGIFIGLMLGAMLGPIFIALTQTSIERGTNAGLLVGLGIWMSDLLIIFPTYYFIQSLRSTIESSDFKFYFGISGGIVLLIFGIGSFFKTIDLEVQKKKHSYKNMIGFWLKGFLVNTINPFTFIVWLGFISTNLIGRNASPKEAWLFLGSIMITIIIANSALVFAAKAVSKHLKERQMFWFSKGSAIGLLICGAYLIVKAI